MIREFGEAYGRQLRELREAAGATQEQLSRELDRLGVKWTRARVAQVEGGRGVPDLSTMVPVAVALTRLGGKPVRLADLLPETENGQVAALRRALLGEPVTLPPPTIGAPPDARADPAYGVVEDLVVKRVNGVPNVVLRVSRDLYGHSGTEERALRAGPDPSPQRLGAMGRGVVRELAEAVEETIARENRLEQEMNAGQEGGDG